METRILELEDYEKPFLTSPGESWERYVSLCRWCSRKFPGLARKDIQVSREFKNAVRFLKWDTHPHEIIIFSRFAMIFSAIILAITHLVSLFFFQPSVLLIFISAIIPVIIAHLITEYPKTEANLEKINALGYAPTILTQIVIYLKQNPNLERALHFVSTYSEGRISNDLKKVLWKCMMGHKISIKVELGKLAQKWGEHLTEIKRSIYLIVASVSEKDEIKRNQTLDRAISVSLEGVVNKIKEYTTNLYLPTLFLFSFGTVLPLVIISLLPIFSFLGGEFASPLQMFSILVVSLLAIYFYSNRIITSRPPSFSSVRLPENLPIYPKPGNLKLKFGKKEFEVRAFLYCLLLFFGISFPGLLFLLGELPFVSFIPGFFTNLLKSFNTLTIIWGFGIAVIVYAHGTSWYKKNLRDNVEKLERESIDGIYQIASRINEGRSPEDTIKHIGATMQKTEFGDLMERTHKILRSRHTTLEDAFFNEEYGSLRKTYSKNFKLIITIFITSLKKGILNSSQTLFTISNHYDQLKKTEEKLKSALKNSLSMMRTTASIFAPMITGLIITLQQLIQDGLKSAKEGLSEVGFQAVDLSFLSTPSFSVELLQLIAGIYMLLLAFLLIRYVSYLEYGKDEIMLKHEIKKNLPIALVVFTATIIISRIFLGA